MIHEFKHLKDCEPLELVRVKLNDESAFAIVGAMEPQSRRGFIVLQNVPKYINFMYDGMIDGDFENYQMLSYGKKYHIDPDEAGECRIGISPLFKEVGSLILTKEARLLAVTDHPSQVRYFNFQTGRMQGEPGQTARAAFARWTLYLEGIETPLIKAGQQVVSQTKA